MFRSLLGLVGGSQHDPNVIENYAEIEDTPDGMSTSDTGFNAGRPFDDLLDFNPPLQTADADYLDGKDVAVARARDMVLNDPYAKNAVRSKKVSVIGARMRFSSMPNHEWLKIEADEAIDWGQKIEARWHIYAESHRRHADVRRMQTFSGMAATGYATYCMSGEAMASVESKLSPLGYTTCFKVFEPEIISTPDKYFGRRLPNGRKIVDGIEMDVHGEPLFYWRRVEHQNEHHSATRSHRPSWRRIPAKTKTGRRRIIHAISNPDRPGMTRGVTEFAAVMRDMKMLQHFGRTELQRAIIQSAFAAVIESDLDSQTALSLLDSQSGGSSLSKTGNPLTDMQLGHLANIAPYHKKMGINFNGARVPHLVPGEKINLLHANTQTSGFDIFEKAFLRKLAAGLGVSYPELSRDYSGTSYSAARLALSDTWRMVEFDRAHFTSEFCMPMFEAWLEEEIIRGFSPLPRGVNDYYGNVDALCGGRFMSWGKPMIDPLKERGGQEKGVGMAVDTLADIAAADGKDWNEQFHQAAREKRLKDKLGIQPQDLIPELAFSASAAPPGDEKDDGDDGSGSPEKD